jgi:hypothetical protein
MKRSALLLLIGSLAANAAFLGVYFFKPSTDDAPPDAVAGSAVESAADGAVKPKDSASAASSGKTREATLFARAWQQAQGGDLETLAERLRAAGFPPAVIRAIVSARVSELFAARRKALIVNQEEIPFWLPQRRSSIDSKTMAALRELSREQSRQLKELLGPDAYPVSEATQAYQRRQFGDLPQDKLDLLQSIVSDYSELRREVQTAANGVMLPEDREKLVLLDKEQRADLEALLTPQELENYDLRSSATASLLRSQLGLFKPTEEEFRAIFKATRAAEEQYGALVAGAANAGQYRQIHAAVLEEVKTLLPPDRLAEFKQATDPAYQQINRLVGRLELPASAAVEVMTVQQDIQKRALALRSNRQAPADQRFEQLVALAEEANTRIGTALGGTRGLEAYKQYGGQWMQTIVPRPSPSGQAVPAK